MSMDITIDVMNLISVNNLGYLNQIDYEKKNPFVTFIVVILISVCMSVNLRWKLLDICSSPNWNVSLGVLTRAGETDFYMLQPP